MHDSTVAPPFPSFLGRYSGLRDGSGEVQTALGGISMGATLFCRPAPKALVYFKAIVMMNLMGTEDVLSSYPCALLCMLYACSRQNTRAPWQQRDRPTKDPPPKKKLNQPKQNKNRRGWVRTLDQNQPSFHTPPQPKHSAMSSLLFVP